MMTIRTLPTIFLIFYNKTEFSDEEVVSKSMAYVFDDDYSMLLTIIAKQIELQANYEGQQGFF